ncbi:hypothetical protein AALP_AA5G036800 [Arabis alpina]|uniref:F-box domain-containing protein n=1 Tax=Arabis alpina TaxID=50452 RepID=A0A087GUR2_ARAAL|nr:hypothetical protein AALP_AA5G036800 [Arabis alpina]
MKKRCLRNEDRISHLPEALLVHILSLLPTKNVVATSALSKQWRHVWKMVPKLEFVSYRNKSKHETFSEIVCRVLLSHKAPVLESLHLDFNVDKCDAMVIGMSIGIAYAHHLRKLVLNVDSMKGDFAFPSSLYKCDTLETLILMDWVSIDLSSPVCLKSLRTLRLEDVEYKNDASVVNLLSGCPILENLEVYRSEVDVEIFTITVPSLQKLTIYDDFNWGDITEDKIGGYVINAPSLKYLKIQGFKGLQFRMIEIASELVEAHIDDVDITIDEKLLGSLTSVKRLSLTSSPLEITFPTGSIFHQLVYLKLSTHKADWWNLLLLMLDCSPKLQVLKLVSEMHGDKEYVGCKKWNQPKNVSECLMRHLETFVWNGYEEHLGEEKEVAKYILRNANHLKRATFSIKDLNSEERLELLEELESAARASKSSCKLLLSD